VLDIIGDGPLLAEMKEEISKLDISNRVVLHGRVSDQKKYEILKQADVYVSASHHEGFGICFFEAMYASLPIIAPNIGGQSDFLASGRNALIVAVGDLEKITRAMNQLASDNNMRKEMGENNKRDVEKYLINNTAKSYELIFEDIISA
jgi:glycosyltransferase involved in cell wall biosynthesis